jgi:hypothetical protein
VSISSSSLNAEKDAAQRIVEKAGRLPLAISQAASYIWLKSSNFITYLRQLESKITQVISYAFHSSGTKYSEGVVSCWRISVDSLALDAARLLRIFAFLSNEGIPEEMLHRGMVSLEWLHGGKFSDHDNTSANPQ